MENREALLEIALELFAERGYDAVGVQEVCDEAGVTKPTLYHYFGSKRGLLETILEERFAPFREVLAWAATYGGDLPATLERVVMAYFRMAIREPSLCRLLLTLWLAPPASEAVEVVAPARAEQRRIVEELFARAAEDHGNMRGRQRAYAMTFLGMVHTHLALGLAGQLPLDPDTAHRAVHQFSHGIYS